MEEIYLLSHRSSNMENAKARPNNAHIFPTSFKKQTFLKNMKANVFLFFERPSTKLSMTYHIFILLLILASLVLSVVSTVNGIENTESMGSFTLIYETILLVIFMSEYCMRLYGSSYLFKYKGVRGCLRFMRTIYMLIDVFIIVSTLATLLVQADKSYFPLLRVTRFMQIFRILRLDRQRGDMLTMGRVVYQHRKELVTCYFVGFVVLFSGTYIVYMLERGKEMDGAITNMADGLYWAMITVTSVGYGDFAPHTWAGKIIGGLFALLGCALFSLPAGILGSGFALQVSKIKNKKRVTKIRNPAALVIQNLWRLYAMKNGNEHLESTWYYMLPQLYQDESPKKHRLAPEIPSGLNKIFKTSLGPATPQSISSMDICESQFLTNGDNSDELSSCDSSKQQNPTKWFNLPLIKITQNDIAMNSDNSVKEKEQLVDSLNIVIMHAIRFLTKLKFLSSVKRFHNIRYPYVSIQDVMEKNALSHSETLAHLTDMKECVLLFQQHLEVTKNGLSIQAKDSAKDSFLVSKQIEELKSEVQCQRSENASILSELKGVKDMLRRQLEGAAAVNTN